MEESISFGVLVSLVVESIAVFSSKRPGERADSRKPVTESKGNISDTPKICFCQKVGFNW